MAETPGELPIDPFDTPEALGFVSNDELQTRFDRTRLFADQSPAEAKGSILWYSVQEQAAFMILAAECGLTTDQLSKIGLYMSGVLVHIVDFFGDGTGLNDDEEEAVRHPLQRHFTELLDDIVGPDSADEFERVIAEGRKRMHEVDRYGEEELLHGLSDLLARTRAERSEE